MYQCQQILNGPTLAMIEFIRNNNIDIQIGINILVLISGD